MSKPDLLDVIDRLVAAMPLDPSKAAAILGVSLVHLVAEDAPAFSAYGLDAAGSAGVWREIEMRMPDPVIGNGSVLLRLVPADPAGIDQAMIGAHFGLDFQMDVPSPRYAPGTVPAYMVYARPWGRLSIGVSADEARRLVSFVLTSQGA